VEEAEAVVEKLGEGGILNVEGRVSLTRRRRREEAGGRDWALGGAGWHGGERGPTSGLSAFEGAGLMIVWFQVRP